MARPRPLPVELTCEPFRLRDASRLGISRTVLRGRRFRRVFHGVYVYVGVPDTLETRVDAARLLLPADAVFSHHTAAELRGLPVPSDGRVHATIRPSLVRPKVVGLAVHEADVPPWVSLRGRPVTGAEPNFVELATTLSLVDLVIVGDAMVRQGFTAPEDLHTFACYSHARGSVRARRGADLVREHVDSPMETRTRLLLVLAGLPCPEPGLAVNDEFGQWLATPDLQYPRQRIAIEYDGDLHRTNKRKWRRDLGIREELRELGWHLIVLTADDIVRWPERTLQRVRQALVDRGHPDVPAVLDPDWQVHFRPVPAHRQAA